MSEAISKVTQALAKSKKTGTLSGLKHTEIQTVMEGMYYQISQALPRHLSPERMIQIVTTEVSRNPAIAECSVSSLVGAVMQASIMGFSPLASLGECYFVPYGKNVGTREQPIWVKEVQFQIGYKGYLKLARQSQQIKQIYAECVYKQDFFKYTLGLRKDLQHEPDLNAEREDKDIDYVYAVAIYKDDTYDFVVLSRKDVEKLRLRSPNQKAVPSGAWQTDYSAMSKAKAVKQLAKWLPLQEYGLGEVEPLKMAEQLDEAVIPLEAMGNRGYGAVLEKTERLPEDAEDTVYQEEEPEALPEPKPAPAQEPKPEPKPAPVEVKPAPEPKKAVAPAPKPAAEPKPAPEPAKATRKSAAEPAPKPKKKLTFKDIDSRFEYDESENCWRAEAERGWFDVYVNEDGTYEAQTEDTDDAAFTKFESITFEQAAELIEMWAEGVSNYEETISWK